MPNTVWANMGNGDEPQALDLSVSAWAEGREVNSRDTIGITNPIS